MPETKQQSVIFPDLADRPVHVSFDQAEMSSDGGAMLLAGIDRKLGLTEAMAATMYDFRQPGKVVHPIEDLLRQRVYGIALGYPDGNDAGRVRADPIHKLVVGRDPLHGESLGSQPTLSRFENSVNGGDLYRLSEALAETVLQRHRKRLKPGKVKRVTIDLDGAVDPTHGFQQLSLFNGYYDTSCYLPLFGFLTFNNEPEQYLFSAMLRPGMVKEVVGALPLLKRVVGRIRELFPKAKILVRVDAGFQGPEVLETLEDLGVQYTVAMASNSVLRRIFEDTRTQARVEGEEADATTRVYDHGIYSARSWKGVRRRVVCKAEYLLAEGRNPKDNTRYVITNLKLKPKTVYELYCMRGDAENRIKEVKLGLEIDRTSCCSFAANQLRVLLAAAAYVLFQELRLKSGHGEFARAQVWTLRERLLKVAVMVERSVRRVHLRFTRNFPWKGAWRSLARRCGAVSAI